MPEITKERILREAQEITGGSPTPERAEELAGILNILFAALDQPMCRLRPSRRACTRPLTSWLEIKT